MIIKFWQCCYLLWWKVSSFCYCPWLRSRFISAGFLRECLDMRYMRSLIWNLFCLHFSFRRYFRVFATNSYAHSDPLSSSTHSTCFNISFSNFHPSFRQSKNWVFPFIPSRNSIFLIECCIFVWVQPKIQHFSLWLRVIRTLGQSHYEECYLGFRWKVDSVK
jgi:hypothetical protein